MTTSITIPFERAIPSERPPLAPRRSDLAEQYFRHVQLFSSMHMHSGRFNAQAVAIARTACQRQRQRFEELTTGFGPADTTWEVSFLCDSASLNNMDPDDRIVGVLSSDGGHDVVVRNLLTHKTRIVRRSADGRFSKLLLETDGFSRFLRNPWTGMAWFIQCDILGWTGDRRDRAVANPANRFASANLDTGEITVVRGNEGRDFLPFQIACSADGTRMAVSDLPGNALHLTDGQGRPTATIPLQGRFPVALDLYGDDAIFVDWGRSNVFAPSRDTFDAVYALDGDETRRMMPSYGMSSMDGGLLGAIFHQGRRICLSHYSLFEIDGDGAHVRRFPLSKIHPRDVGGWLPYTLGRYEDDLALTLWKNCESAVYRLRLNP